MKRVGVKLQIFCGISRKRKILFFKVIGLSIYRGFLFYSGSPKAFSEKIIKQFPNSEVTKQQLNDALDIAFAVGLGAKYIPWTNQCRHQAWQAIYFLNQKDIPYTYQVGVKIKNKEEGHSWVIVEKKFISGSCQINEYALLKT